MKIFDTPWCRNPSRSYSQQYEDLRDLLHKHDLRGYNEVHDVGVDAVAFAGELGRANRYQFVDVRNRGELQSYVVE